MRLPCIIKLMNNFSVLISISESVLALKSKIQVLKKLLKSDRSIRWIVVGKCSYLNLLILS